MNREEIQNILERFKTWFIEELVESHKRNTMKLKDIEKFNINPFLLPYLANYLEGNSDPQSLAKVLVYPRVLGSSITTSFGTKMQRFVTNVLGAYGSSIPGIDIEFIDQIDHRRKYCQLKSGPYALNRDDVTTVKNHFRGIISLARTNNNNDISVNDLIFCLIYGEEDEKNAFIKEVEHDYTVYIGKEFWHRFTGEENFYRDICLAAGEVASEINLKDMVEDVIEELSGQIETRLNFLLS